MANKFVLVRKQREGKQNDSRPVIRVTPETYETLVKRSLLTGKSITEIAAKTVAFAAEHLEVVDE